MARNKGGNGKQTSRLIQKQGKAQPPPPALKTMSTNMKLSPMQKLVIKKLREGWVLVTNSGMKGADVAGKVIEDKFHISNRVFWNLVDKGMIYQSGMEDRFYYILTEKGKTIKL